MGIQRNLWLVPLIFSFVQPSFDKNYSAHHK